MTEDDSRRILAWIDSAVELFHRHRGQLTAREVRILSMLSVARQELSEGLSETARRSAARKPPQD